MVLLSLIGVVSIDHSSLSPVALSVSAGPGRLEGFDSPLPAVYWTAAVVAAGVVLWAVLRARSWGAASFWIALALAGQACSLQLLWVGPDIRLQLFYGWSNLLRSYQGVFLVTLLLQTAIVAYGLRQSWAKLKGRCPRVFGWPGGLVFFALQAYAATTIQPGVAQAFVGSGFARQAVLYGTKVALGLLVFGTGAANLALAAARVPPELWERISRRWRKTDRAWLPWLCALWVVAVSSVLAWFALERMPHVPDEVAYIFQAKYLATGRLYLSAPPDSQALYCPFQIVEGNKWYGAPPPGWPLVFAVGFLAGVPWLVNPLLGGVAVLLAHRLVQQLYERDVADGVALLLAGSPWLLFLSASYMPHPTAVLCLLVALLGVQHARETGSLVWGVISGLALGALLHVRPLEAVAVAFVAGLWWLSAGWRKLRFAALLVAALAGLMMTGLFLLYNRTLTGDPLLVPLTKFTDQTYYPGSNRLGFGPDIGNWGWTGLDALPGHGPIDVFMNTSQNLYLMNFELFGWASGSLLLVFLAFVCRRLREDGMMWGLLLILWAAMSLYWFSGGPDFGPRYWYPMILPAAVLTVRGARALIERLRASGLSSADSQRVWAFVALASLLGVVNLLPWRSLDKYHNYRGVRADIRWLEGKHHFGHSLVLVRGPEWPDYASAFPFNPATFNREAPGPIYARELGPTSTERLRNYYEDRPVWVLAGPTETGNGFQVVERPSSSSAERSK